MVDQPVRGGGLSGGAVRAGNRGEVLRLIATGDGTSRIALARASGLTKMSISNIIGEFLEKGIVRELDSLQNAALGRNPVELEIGPQAPKFVGVLVHREFCRAVLCDLHLHILREEKVLLNEENTQDLPACLLALIQSVGGAEAVAIGVASIGPVDPIRGLVLNPPNFYGIQNLPIGEYLEKCLGKPVLLDGQYNCAALAEHHYGHAPADFLFVGISNGIGSGVLSAGVLQRSCAGLAAELGHLSVDYQGRPCLCGSRGCLETYCAATVLLKEFPHASFEALCEDPAAEAFLLEKCEILSAGLTSAVNLFNPRAVLLGDEGVFLPESCLMAIESQVNAHKLSGENQRVRVLRPHFYDKSQLVGAACLPIDACFGGSIPL